MKCFLFIFCVICFSDINAQDSSFTSEKMPEQKDAFWNRAFVGGNLGLQFGSVTFIDISPLVGYKITERFSAGIGGSYWYYKYNTPPYSFSTDVYGGRVFARYFFLENLFGHSEYEVLSLETFDFRSRINVESFFVGGGYNHALGRNAYASLMVLYNLNESVYSPYSNPIIRVGMGFGL